MNIETMSKQERTDKRGKQDTQAEQAERFPMSQTEKLLKKLFLLRPELNAKILSHTELAEYIVWLAQMSDKVDKNTEWSIDTDAFPVSPDSPLAELAGRLRANPEDKQALSAMSSIYENQREGSYFLANYDISIGQMLRYMPAHWHTNDHFEALYCFSGTCPIYFADETIVMKPGTVLIIAPSVLYASPCYQDDSVLFYYMARSSTFDKVFWNQLDSENLMSSFFRQALGQEEHSAYLHFETDVDEEIEQLLLRISNEFFHPRTYTAQMLNALMSEFFILLLRRYEDTAKLPRTKDFYWKQEFSAIFSYIRTHYQDMTLAEIAEHFHYSERQITRIVINCTGSNYSQLVLKLRMEKAANLLRQQAGSVESISSAVGYSTLSSFYRAFTRYFHCTPIEYQNRSSQ